jgi:TolB-like protein
VETRANPTQAWHFGVFKVDLRNMELRRSGTAVKIREQSFRILIFLLEHAGELVTREDLRQVLWPSGTFVDFDHSLNTAVMKLRGALGDSADAPLYIETIPKHGYRFIAPLSQAAGVRSGSASAKDDANGNPIFSLIEANDQSGADSIAVLPFETGTSESDGAYLSEGFTASIINNLSQLKDLRVVPTTTAFKYIGRSSEASRCARELNVRVVLTGAIAKLGNALTISAELIDAARESQLWETRYNCQLENIVAIQAEIAFQVAIRLRLRVGDTERKQLARLPTENREAYHLYLKAMHWANKWTVEGMSKGIDYTRQAIDADPAYAEAWIALAYLFTLIGALGRGPATETFAKAKAAARKALEIDDRSANAYAILAYVRLIGDWNWEGAYDALLRAIEISPNLAGGHYVYSYWCLTQGLFEEALSEGRLALNLDPLSAKLSLHLGLIHYFARRYDQAIEQFDKTRELDPSFSLVSYWFASAYARSGMQQKAVAELDKGIVLTATDALVSKATRGIIDAMTGKRPEARRILDELTQELKPPDFLFAYPCAVIHSLLGEIDQALACLEMCLQGRAPQLPWLATDPDFDSLHGDPRFDELLRRIGIPASRIAVAQDLDVRTT